MAEAVFVIDGILLYRNGLGVCAYLGRARTPALRALTTTVENGKTFAMLDAHRQTPAFKNAPRPSTVFVCLRDQDDTWTWVSALPLPDIITELRHPRAWLVLMRRLLVHTQAMVQGAPWEGYADVHGYAAEGLIGPRNITVDIQMNTHNEAFTARIGFTMSTKWLSSEAGRRRKASVCETAGINQLLFRWLNLILSVCDGCGWLQLWEHRGMYPGIQSRHHGLLVAFTLSCPVCHTTIVIQEFQ